MKAALDTPNVSFTPLSSHHLPGREPITHTEFSSGGVIHQGSLSPVHRFPGRFPGALPTLNGPNSAVVNSDAPPLTPLARCDASSWSQTNHETYGTFSRYSTLQSLSAPPGVSRGCVSNTANKSNTALPDMGSQRSSALHPYQPTVLTASHNYGSADERLVNVPNDDTIVSNAHETGDVECIHPISAPAVNEIPPRRTSYVDHDVYFDFYGNQWAERREGCNSGRPFGTPSTHEQQIGKFVDKVAYSLNRQAQKGMNAAGYLFGPSFALWCVPNLTFFLKEIRDQYLTKRNHNAELSPHQLPHTSAWNGFRYDDVASGISHFGDHLALAIEMSF